MRTRDAHRRLLLLLCLVLCATVALLAGGGALLPERAAHGPVESYDQVAESFDRVVPGMTRVDDLPSLGFDTIKADMLSPIDLERRFLRGARRDDPTLRDCIQAGIYCTGFVFHAAAAADPFGLQRITHNTHRPADIVLLVMNGRVIHKVFSDSPDRGIAVARAF